MHISHLGKLYAQTRHRKCGQRCNYARHLEYFKNVPKPLKYLRVSRQYGNTIATASYSTLPTPAFLDPLFMMAVTQADVEAVCGAERLRHHRHRYNVPVRTGESCHHRPAIVRTQRTMFTLN